MELRSILFAGLAAMAASAYGGRLPKDATGDAIGITGDVMTIDISAGPSATEYPVRLYENVDIGRFNVSVYKASKIALRRIPAGTYPMKPGVHEGPQGINDLGEGDTGTTGGYWIGIFQVTESQYDHVRGNGAIFDYAPETSLSYQFIRGVQKPSDAVAGMSFMKLLCDKARYRGLAVGGFDLPTDGQWEIAARAGSTAADGEYWSNGVAVACTDANRSDYAWIVDRSVSIMTPFSIDVGSLKPNRWGLYDTIGNAWEWCRDGYVDSRDLPTVEDLPSRSDPIYRILRGYPDGAGHYSPSVRSLDEFDCVNSDYGFRLARTGPELPTFAEWSTVTVGEDGEDVVIDTAYPSDTKLVKAGGGSMVTNRRLPGLLQLDGGEFTVRAKAAYEHYRFKVDKVSGTHANSMQISEFRLLDEDADVTRPYAGVVRADVGAASPVLEGPGKAVDGLLTTKFLDFNGNPSGDYCDYCWLQLDYAAPLAITHYNWATANDHYNSIGDVWSRNPKNWRLQGSHDGTDWDDLDIRTDFVEELESNSWCAVDFPVRYNGGTSMSNTTVIVKSGASIAVTDRAVIGSLVMQGGQVKLQDSVLQLDGSGYAVGGGISGSGMVVKSGTGTFEFGGMNTFNGGITVSGGTLKLRDNAKWFRLTIKRTGSDSAMQFSEFGLYDLYGSRVNAGLAEVMPGTYPRLLQPGTFARGDEYDCMPLEGAVKIFDADAGTKWCEKNADLGETTDDPSKWFVVTMRIAEDAAPVIGCNLCTANDAASYPGRSPREWMVEASYDGIAWFTVGEYSVENPPSASGTWYSDEPYHFTASAGSLDTPLPWGTFVEVCPGATLDCAGMSGVLTSLRYDASSGGGTVRDFSPSANGTLMIVNSSSDVFSRPLDLTLTGIVRNAQALGSWSVTVNGRPIKAHPCFDPDTGRIFIRHLPGMMLFIR